MLQRQVSWPSLMRMFENPVIKTSYHKEQDGGGWVGSAAWQGEREARTVRLSFSKQLLTLSSHISMTPVVITTFP